MNCNATVKKLIQITEEAQPPVHVPVVFGNECFIVTQQDLRKIEDIRLLSYSKLTPNGEIIPMETLGHDVSIRDAILNAGKYRMQLDHSGELTNTNMLLEFIRKVLGYPQSMDTSEILPQIQPVATLEQKIQWVKAFNETDPLSQLPQTNTYATPKVDSNSHNVMYHACNCCCSNNNNSNKKNINHCGSNTMDTDDVRNNDGGAGILSAREQLKQKKVAQEISLFLTEL